MRAPSTRRGPFAVVALSLVFAACQTTPTSSPSPDASGTAVQPSPSQASSPAVVATGRLAVGRTMHTATLLRSGRILVVGGYDGDDVPLRSAELYDPASDTFLPTGSLAVGRGFHTATLLADGRVLIAGGGAASWASASGSGATAELYDPTTGTFSPTGSMATPRESHTATLLADGRVLITGGNDVAGHAVATAELYDLTTGTFRPTGSMAAARASQTATLLVGGRVLVSGGQDGEWTTNGVLASAELYDPVSGVFTATGSLAAGRAYHTAALLPDGRVLVAGGSDGPKHSLDSAEVYDPRTGRFAPTGSMTRARTYVVSTSLSDGHVLITGGDPLGGNWGSRPFLASAEVYDPTSGAFAATGSMEDGRVFHQATRLADARVVVTAGDGKAGPLSSASVWDPATGSFSQAAALPWPTPPDYAATVGVSADDGARIVAVESPPLYDSVPSTRARDLTIDSPAVGIVRVRLLLPSAFDAQPATRWPVLYLLDGGSSSYKHWTQYFDIEELTAPTDLLVVMPDAGDGWYSDWLSAGTDGRPRWETFHMVELRQLIERNYRAGDMRAIAGFSMGGYGAMEYASRFPGMFLFAASFSGPLDILGGASFTRITGVPSELWGGRSTNIDVWRAHDPLANAAKLKGTTLFVSAGNGDVGPLDGGEPQSDDPTGRTEREIGIETTAFVARLGELGIPVTADLYGAGTHSVPYTARELHLAFPLLLKALGL